MQIPVEMVPSKGAETPREVFLEGISADLEDLMEAGVASHLYKDEGDAMGFEEQQGEIEERAVARLREHFKEVRKESEGRAQEILTKRDAGEAERTPFELI